MKYPNKKHFLFLPAGLLVGFFAGYFEHLQISSLSGAPAVGEQETFSFHSANLTKKGSVPSSLSIPASFSFLPEEKKLLESLYRYSQMPTEALIEEWIKTEDIFDFFNDVHNIKTEYIIRQIGFKFPQYAVQLIKKYPHTYKTGTNQADTSTPSVQLLPKSRLREKDSLMLIILSDWIKRDPKAALAYCKENKKDCFTYATIPLLASSLSQEIIPWLENNDIGDKSHLYASLIKTIPEKSFPFLAAVLEKEGNIPLYPGMEFAEKWAASDGDSALRWIDSQNFESIEDKSRILQEALASLPPDRALAELEKRNDVDKTSVLFSLANRLSDKSPQEALEWIVAHASEIQLKEAMDSEGYLPFLSKNNTELTAHVLGLEAGKDRDVMLGLMATQTEKEWIVFYKYSLNFTPFDKRLELASRITTPDLRNKITFQVLTQWSSEQPQTAIENIERSLLSPEQKETLILRCRENIRESHLPYGVPQEK